MKVNSVSVSLTCFSCMYHSHGRLNNEIPTLPKLTHEVTVDLVEALPAAVLMKMDKADSPHGEARRSSEQQRQLYEV